MWDIETHNSRLKHTEKAGGRPEQFRQVILALNLDFNNLTIDP